MPYNTSPAVVKRNLQYLDSMLSARRTLTWPTAYPDKLAYRLREALNAVQKHEQFTPYHSLKAWYRIRSYDDWVEAEYIGPPAAHDEPHKPSAMRVNEVEDAHGVVGACIKYAQTADELHFPNAKLDEEELHAVYKWGKAERPHWKLISHGDAGVTMTRKDNVEPIFLWRPDNE